MGVRVIILLLAVCASVCDGKASKHHHSIARKHMHASSLEEADTEWCSVLFDGGKCRSSPSGDAVVATLNSVALCSGGASCVIPDCDSDRWSKAPTDGCSASRLKGSCGGESYCTSLCQRHHKHGKCHSSCDGNRMLVPGVPCPSGKQCCVPTKSSPSTCEKNKGECQSVHTSSCDGSLRSGMCPGNSHVQCCLPKDWKPASEPASEPKPSSPKPAKPAFNPGASSNSEISSCVMLVENTEFMRSEMQCLELDHTMTLLMECDGAEIKPTTCATQGYACLELNPFIANGQSRMAHTYTKCTGGEDASHNAFKRLVGDLKNLQEYKQCDKTWACEQFTGNGCDTTNCKRTAGGSNANNICASGCGITSSAIVMSFYGKSLDPADTVKLFRPYRGKGGGKTCNGVTHTSIRKVLESQGFTVKWVGATPAKLDTALKSGPVIFHVKEDKSDDKDCKYTNGGHYIVIKEKVGDIYQISDPGSRQTKRKTGTKEELFDDCKVAGLAIVTPNQEASEPAATTPTSPATTKPAVGKSTKPHKPAKETAGKPSSSGNKTHLRNSKPVKFMEDLWKKKMKPLLYDKVKPQGAPETMVA